MNSDADVSVYQRVIASSVGGFLTAVMMTPLDVIKIRMQLISQNKCFIYCNGLMEHLCTCTMAPGISSTPWYKRAGNFTGTWVGFHSDLPSRAPSTCIFHTNHPDGFLSQRSMSATDAVFKIIRTEGVFSLWSGLSPTLAMALPQTVIYYTVNDWLKNQMGYRSNPSRNNLKSKPYYDLIPPLVGGASRMFAVVAISPLELMRTKMQSVRIRPSDLCQVLLRSIKQDGLLSLWTGMGATLLRDVPYSMVFWLVFDYSKSKYLKEKQLSEPLFSNLILSQQLNFTHAFAFGAFAGLIAGLLTHPFDVIKTHKQVELGNALITDRPYPKSTWLSLQRLYNSGGLRALFSGFTPRLLKTTHASAIMIATFESFKYYFVNSVNHLKADM